MATESKTSNAHRVAQCLSVSMVKEEYPPGTISFMLWPDKLLGTPSFILYFWS